MREDDGLVHHLRDRFEIGAHRLSLVSLDPPAPRRRIRFVTACGEPVGGWLLEPETPRPAPAILYIHAHGGDYRLGADEVVNGRPALQGPLGPELARCGFRVLAVEMPCFGGRSGVTEGAAAKAALWHGGSLAGQMLGELASALDWLEADSGSDPRRIGAFGLSMGATLGYWLAAVDPRIAACAHLCCFADFGTLIESGAHDLHGIYLTIPGLLRIATNGKIAGLVAPRPQFVGLGAADALTPPAATAPALAALRDAYAAADADNALRVHREPHSGHVETPEMRRALLRFFAEALDQRPIR